jgi:transcriptional regulator with XRE-family HTH domain
MKIKTQLQQRASEQSAEIMLQISEEIRRLKLTRQHVAEVSGIGQTNIKVILSGERVPTLPTVLALQAAISQLSGVSYQPASFTREKAASNAKEYNPAKATTTQP